MPRRSPGAKAKGLGAELRGLRLSADMTIVQAAGALGLSKQAVSRLETGKRNIAPNEVAGLCALYGVTGTRRDHLLTMARTLDEPGWWELGLPGVTQESATLIDYEDQAERITSWAPLLMPGLLQTTAYSRSYMMGDGVPSAQVEARLTARLRRQDRLSRGDVDYLAYVGEPALCGSDDIHRAQLVALLDALRRPNVSIRVVPTPAIPRQVRLGGFLMVESPPVVHVELARSGVFLDEEELIAPYREMLTALAAVALGDTESADRISYRLGNME